MTARADTLIRIKVTDPISLDNGSFDFGCSVEDVTKWANGTSDGQIDAVWSDTRIVTTASAVTLDLQALAQLDSDGNTMRTVNFETIKAIYIFVGSTASSVLTVGNTAHNFSGTNTPWAAPTDSVVVQANSTFAWQNPVGGTVTVDVTDDLLYTASGADVTVTTVIIGESA